MKAQEMIRNMLLEALAGCCYDICEVERIPVSDRTWVRLKDRPDVKVMGWRKEEKDAVVELLEKLGVEELINLYDKYCA